MIVARIATHFTARHSVARQTQAAADNPQTAIMNKLTLYIFPMGVLVGGFFFPIAILLYWLSNNAWTLGQQHIVYQRIDPRKRRRRSTATTKRQALAPKPGAKPVSPAEAARASPRAPADGKPEARSPPRRSRRRADRAGASESTETGDRRPPRFPV